MKKLMIVFICIAGCCFCSCASSDNSNKNTTKLTTKETYDYMTDDEKIEFFGDLDLPQEYEIENFSFEFDDYDGVIIYAEIAMSNEDLRVMLEKAGTSSGTAPKYKNDDVSWWDLKEEDIIENYSHLYSPRSKTSGLCRKTAYTFIYECEGKFYLKCFG